MDGRDGEGTCRSRWWIEVTPSQFTHEAEGLNTVRSLLPESPPFTAWSNDDCLEVRELVADLMSDAVGTTVKETVRQTVEAITHPAAAGGVTVKQPADHLQLERSAAQYRVQAARDGGFIVNIEDRRGMPARYDLGNPLPAEVVLLPKAILGQIPVPSARCTM